jgi:hypothetical protein
METEEVLSISISSYFAPLTFASNHYILGCISKMWLHVGEISFMDVCKEP